MSNCTCTATPSPNGTNQEFSHLNVVGMFLTLQLCQLTQPYGGLLFREGQIFFWRFNSIASFTEGCIICWHLGKAIALSWNKGFSAVMETLQETSGGLLLVRGATGSHRNGELMKKLMSQSFLGTLEINGTAMVPREGPASASGQAHGEEPRPSLSQQSAAVAMPQLQPDHVSSSNDLKRKEESRILHEAFGANALIHKEFRTDLFTSFTMLVVFIKLVATHGNPWFTTACLFIIFGWSAVQTLLVLFHRQEMSEARMASAVHVARSLDDHLNRQIEQWQQFFVCLHIPMFDYYLYTRLFTPRSKGPSARSVPFLYNFIVWEDILIGYSVLGFIVAVLLKRTPISIGPFWRSSLYALTASIVLGWLVPSTVSHVRQKTEAFDGHCKDNCTTIFKPQTVPYYLVDRSLDPVLKFSWLVASTVSSWLVYLLLTLHADNRNSNGGLVWRSVKHALLSYGHAVVVSYTFLVFLYHYDPSKTFKPAWTDILG